MITINVELDARGLACPMPLLKLKQHLNRMQAGECIRVVTTDAGSVRDFEVFVRQAGHGMHEALERDGEYHFVIEKHPDAAPGR